MGLESPKQIPVRSYIMIQPSIPKLIIPGRASVRYCTRSRNGNYRVGVEFNEVVVFDKIPEMQKARSRSPRPSVLA